MLSSCDFCNSKLTFYIFFSSGHVAHHLFFTRIPHYNLMKATAAVQKVLAPFPGVYKKQDTYWSLWELFRLLFRLDYLMGKPEGMYKYRASEDFKKVE